MLPFSTSCAVITRSTPIFVAISAQAVLWVGVMVTLAALSFQRLKFLEQQRVVRGYRHHRQLLVSLVIQVSGGFRDYL